MSEMQYKVVPVKYILDPSKITSVGDIVEILQSFGIQYNDEVSGTSVEKYLTLNPEYVAYQSSKAN